jgi:broad specificity phosphatase PhoE
VTARLTLVRHGRATGGWDDHTDPGLDDVGRAQAEALAGRLQSSPPQPIVVSPMRRCRETAAPLAAAWGVIPQMEPALTEIPSPEGIPMGQRVPWLRMAMGSTWTALASPFTAYRDAVVARLVACATDTLVVSHFVAINAAIGAALGDDRLMIYRLDNTSRTVLDVHHGRLVLVEAGAEADTQIR